jgi:tetratricopeptide (TPR) repeat protein
MEPAMVLDASFNLGVVLGELGRLNEAAEAYAATLKLEPNHQGALLNLAALWYSEHTARAELYQQEQRQHQQQQQQGQGRQHQRQQQNGVIVQGDNSLLDTALELVERALANNPASDDAKGLREKVAAAMASSR